MEVNEDTLGFEAIREVGHGGHFFGSHHTLSRYAHAFYHPILTDTRNFEDMDRARLRHRRNPCQSDMEADARRISKTEN